MARSKRRPLDRRPPAANEAHHELEQKEQQPDLEEQAENRRESAEAAEKTVPGKEPEKPGADEAAKETAHQAASETAGEQAAVWHWLPVLVLTWVWSGLFAVNTIMKEASMSRYPEWQAYRAHTGWFLPKFVYVW